MYTMYSYMKIFTNKYLSHLYHPYLLYSGENKNWYQKKSIYLQKGKAKSYTTGHTD